MCEGQGKRGVEVKMMDRIIEPHCVVWVCENGVFNKTRGWRRECEVEVDRGRHMCAGKVLSVQHDEMSAEWKDFCFMLKVVGGVMETVPVAMRRALFWTISK